jgi:hypothetical protein
MRFPSTLRTCLAFWTLATCLQAVAQDSADHINLVEPTGATPAVHAAARPATLTAGTTEEIDQLRSQVAALEARLNEPLHNEPLHHEPLHHEPLHHEPLEMGYESQEYSSSYREDGYESYGGSCCGGGMSGESTCGGSMCGHRCRCCSNPCCRSSGFVGGAEGVFLEPYNSAGTGFNTADVAAEVVGLPPIFDVTTTLAAEVDPDFEATGRVWVGYQGKGGLGVRARYWEFDDGADAAATLLADTIIGLVVETPVDIFHDWDTSVFDVEVFDTSRLGCHWDATWSAGYRHVEYEEARGLSATADAVVPVEISLEKEFDGDGLTAGFEVRRRMGGRFGLFASARGSVLFGDEDNTLAVDVPTIVTVDVTDEEENVVKSIFETQMGVEFVRPAARRATLFARGGVEAQYWDSFGVPGVLTDESVGFFGFFGSVGLSR